MADFSAFRTNSYLCELYAHETHTFFERKISMCIIILRTFRLLVHTMRLDLSLTFGRVVRDDWSQQHELNTFTSRQH